MSACEACWRKANERAMLFGGSVVDHYRKLLAEYPNGYLHDDDSPTATVDAADSEPTA